MFLFFFGHLHYSWSSPYADSRIIFQSLDNPSEKIIYQYYDYGVGSEDREVKVIEYSSWLRYSKEFSSIKINGNWVKYNNTGKADTLRLKNYVYHKHED